MFWVSVKLVLEKGNNAVTLPGRKGLDVTFGFILVCSY